MVSRTGGHSTVYIGSVAIGFSLVLMLLLSINFEAHARQIISLADVPKGTNVLYDGRGIFCKDGLFSPAHCAVSDNIHQ